MAESLLEAPISQEIYQAYFGLNSDYYMVNLKLFERTNFKTSWNWSAFLFPVPWLFYRKVWSYGFILLVINLILIFIWFNFMLVITTALLYILLMIAVGMLGNNLYFNYARRTIVKEQIMLVNREVSTGLARKIGGTNLLSSFLIFGLYSGLFFINNHCSSILWLLKSEPAYLPDYAYWDACLYWTKLNW